MRRLLYLVPFGLLAGCVHTKVVKEEVTPHEAVYHQILVCALSADAERADLIESTVRGSLKKRGVKTATCHDFLNPGDTSDQQKIAIQNAGYQAILVFQRVASEEKPGPIRAAAVLQNETTSEYTAVSAESGESMESSSATDTLNGFLKSYAARASSQEADLEKSAEVTEEGLTGKRRSITGVIKLIDVNQNQVSWLGGGAVEGPESESLKTLMKAVAARAIDELSSAGLIP